MLNHENMVSITAGQINSKLYIRNIFEIKGS